MKNKNQDKVNKVKNNRKTTSTKKIANKKEPSSKLNKKNKKSKHENTDKNELINNKVEKNININNKKEEYFNYSKDTFKVIEDYIKNYFHKHHVDSFNKFLDETLQQIINKFNPIVINYDYDSKSNKYRYEVVINFLDYFIEEPIVYENNDSYKR